VALSVRPVQVATRRDLPAWRAHRGVSDRRRCDFLLVGLFKAGRLAEFFSESVLTGVVFGLAPTIVIKQVRKIFRLESDEGMTPASIG